MSNKQLRNVIRAVHLLISILLLALVYSDSLRQSESFVTLVRVVVPMVVASGIAMWQQASITKLRRSLSNRKAAEA
jgi:hypothetical protein